MDNQTRRHHGFTFVEAVFTIAIIGIMASLAVSAISNGARDANRIMARQQQTAVQEAVNAWVTSQARVTVAGVETGQVQSMERIRTLYNSLGTTKSRFEKLKPNSASTDPATRAGFLDVSTADHFDAYTFGSDKLKTSAMESSRQYLSLPEWAEGDEPRVILMDE